MPNIKSAKKRVLVNKKKNKQNRSEMTEVKSIIKKYNNAIDINSVEEAEKLLPLVFSALDTAVSKGLIHKNNSSNKKSSLAKKLFDVKSGKVVISIKKDNKTIAAEKAKVAQDARDSAKAEYIRIAAEKKTAKIDAEQAKLAANAKPVKAKKADKKVEEAEVKETAPAAKKTAKAKDEVKDAAPAAKKTAKAKDEIKDAAPAAKKTAKAKDETK